MNASPDGHAAATAPVRRAAITNLGCKVNQSEMDAVERVLRAQGVEIVDDADHADLYVVNTCTVTSVADQKSRHAVRRARRANPDARILVTGCSVQVDPASFARTDSGARLVDNRAKDRLLDELLALIELPEGAAMPTLSGVDSAVEAFPEHARPLAVHTSHGGLEDEAAEAGRGRRGAAIDGISDDRMAIDRTRAFVKVQDGCSFYCTYCIIPKARGHERSLEPEAVLADVRRALAAGHREIVLTGINVGTYDGGASERGARGSHAWEALSLPGLIRRLLDETPVERIRLSSIEPQHVSDDLLRVWNESDGRCLPHFHLPLQSADDGVLRRMGRRYDAAFYAALVGRVRDAIPGVAVHADVIVGFPTEDDAAWSRTVDFIRAIDFAGIHVFRYSGRPGTPALRMAGQVDEKTKKRRSAEALALAAEARARFARRQLGRELRVLFESPLPEGRWLGHAENHVLVEATTPDGRDLENAVGLVRAVSVSGDAPDRLRGELLAVDWPRPVRALPLLSPAAVRSGVVPSGVSGPPPPPDADRAPDDQHGAHHAA